MIFYVYKHIRLDTNTTFYVGKGSGKRSKSKHRNQYWKNIVKSAGYRVEIVHNSLTEEQAFEKEIELIKFYKHLGYCEANLSDGGEGPCNPCSSTRQKMAEAKKGKPGNRRTKLIDTITGQIYNSVKEAAQTVGLKRTTLNQMLLGLSPNKTNLTYYKFADTVQPG